MRTPFVFLTSQAYSGSTLLAFLLGAHPEIATVGEMTGLVPMENPSEYLCSCETRIKECDFWKAVTSAMQAHGFTFDVMDFGTRFELGSHPVIRRLRTGSLRSHSLETIRDLVFRAWPGHTGELRALAARNEALAQSVLEVTGKRVFLDSSKVHMRIKYLLQYSNLDISVIHLVRDARGVVTSTLGHKPGTSAQQAAQSWVHRNNNIQRQLASFPEDKHIRVRYEDVCQNTQDTLAQLYGFCGVDPHFEVTDFRSVEHHVVGNQMRLRASSEIRLDERWKRELDEAQLEEIDQVTGEMNHYYGYS
jgi:hypothetical protein